MGGPISRKVPVFLANVLNSDQLSSCVQLSQSDPFCAVHKPSESAPFQAILGGKCVDTGEDLGPPLTSTVRAYLTVAGANKGAMLCVTSLVPVCNRVNGMHCESAFIKDINAK